MTGADPTLPTRPLPKVVLDPPILPPLCEARGVGVIIGGPYNAGVLAGGEHFDDLPAPPAVMARVARLRTLCADHGVALPAAALHYPLRRPAVVSVIPGARSEAEARSNLAAIHAPPPESLWAALVFEGLIAAGAA